MTMAEVSLALEIHDLAVEYKVAGKPPVRAVAGVNLSVSPGEIVGLVGESGCGKSTLARAAVGLAPRAAGTVRLGGEPVAVIGAGARPMAQRRLQLVFQDPYSSLNPRRRIWKQVADGVPGGARGRGARDRAVELLAAVGVPAAVADRFPHEFSGGQRQRIAIARALGPDPAVIVADEAVSALDASTRAQVSNLLVELTRERGMGLLFISHDLSIVRHIATRVAVMYLGTIVEQAPTAELWSHPRHPYTQALMAAVPQLGERAQAPAAPTGEVPDPARPPTGCRFHPRCPLVQDRCRIQVPELAGGAHQDACLLSPSHAG